MKHATFDALIIGCVDAIAYWVAQIRAGESDCPKDARIIALQPRYSKALEGVVIDVILERPFKVGQVPDAVLG